MFHQYTYLIRLCLLSSCILSNYAFATHNIPIFDEINIDLDDCTVNTTQTSHSPNNIFNLTTKNSKRTSLNDVITTIKMYTPFFSNEDDNEDETNNENSTNNQETETKKIEQLTLFLDWINKHIKDGILYHNGMEIHDWMHQLIYAIETLNAHFLYPWLLTYLAFLPQCYVFNEDIVPKDIIQKNEPLNYQFVFDEPDFFYTWLFFFIINGPLYDEQSYFILRSNITLLEKNSDATLDFFKKIRNKYKIIIDGKDGSNEQQMLFEETDTLVGNIQLLASMMEIILHESTDINQSKSPRIKILYGEKNTSNDFIVRKIRPADADLE